MTRIIHVASGREWRGGQRQTWLLVRELQRLGADQVLVTQRGSELAKRAKAAEVPLREVSWTLGIDPRAGWAVRQEAGRGRSILHAHDGHAVTIARWASTASAPWIATRRNASPLGDPSGWRSAARVIAISQAVRKQLLSDHIPDDRIAVVPSGIDLEATRATPHEDLRAWAHIPNGGVLIVTVASVTPEKGLLYAMAAAGSLHRDHRDFHWVVIGDGPGRAGFAGTSKRQFDSRVVFPGHHPDPVRLLRGADLFVLPSLSEGLGTSVLDAMALDLPVIVSDTGGLTELVGEDAGLLVPPADSQSLAVAIGRMLDDPALRRRCVAAGRATVGRYTVQAMAAGMRTVYDSVDANR